MIKPATTTRRVPVTFHAASARENGLCEVKHVQPAAPFHGASRETVKHFAADLSRTIRSSAALLRAVVGDGIMPAEAVDELDAAQVSLERTIHWRGGTQTRERLGADAMRSVQRIHAAVDLLSHDIERWSNEHGGVAFPGDVVAALEKELSRVEQLQARAKACGE